MPTVAEVTALADPVCGRPVTLAAEHHHVHAGALFVFCSADCHAAFAAHPRRWAFITLSGGTRPPAPRADLPAVRRAPPPASSLLTRWREKRFALACCKEMLELYHAVARRRPELVGEALYRHVVAQRVGADGPAADELIRGAARSYASWPAERALTFRDVVRYVAVSEFVGLNRDTPWVHDGLKQLVHDTIPARL